MKVSVLQSVSMSTIFHVTSCVTMTARLPRIMCWPVFVPHSRGRGPAPEWAENWAVRHWVRGVARESPDTEELGADTENVSKLSRNWQMSGELRHI